MALVSYFRQEITWGILFALSGGYDLASAVEEVNSSCCHLYFEYQLPLVCRPSVRPSVRSLKYPLLTCTWVRWSTRPTVTVLRHVRPSVRPSVCPSVRPERFRGICHRMHGGISLKFYMLMYLDHCQNWLVYGHGLLIFLILALFWLSETGQIWGFRVFPGERIEGMAWNFFKLLYLDHLQNWLDYGYGLVIFLILALFWLSETVQIWGFRVFSGEHLEEMAWNFACWCILSTYRTD